MTQPSEEAIRKACEEAGVDANEFIALYQSAPGIVVNYPWMNAILALARRIETEREAVMVTGDSFAYRTTWDGEKLVHTLIDPNELYAAPPKEPTDA